MFSSGLLPSSLLDALTSIPPPPGDLPDSQEATTSNERALKRRKVDHSPASSICIDIGTISITRRCADDADSEYEIHRDNVGEHLGLGYSKGWLRVLSRSTSPIERIHVALQLSAEELSPMIEAMLGVCRSNVATQTPGEIWRQLDLIVGRKDNLISITLTIRLFWNETPSPYHRLRIKIDREFSQTLIDNFFPAHGDSGHEIGSSSSDLYENDIWSPMAFYDAAFVPSKENHDPITIEVPGLEATLYPYQKRTLSWLLNREGVQWSTSSLAVEPRSSSDDSTGMGTFRPARDANGRNVYVSEVFQAITTNLEPFQTAEALVRGGILAEEMGLGKTLEILGLVLLHPRPPEHEDNTMGQTTILRSGATLIVTPESLRMQWLSEINRHAPGLKVKYYQGRRRIDRDEDEVVQELASYDIVLTTYTVLSAELHYTLEPPERSRRHERAYQRPKSPLVQISWWRVCLDEAQMIENGFSQAATVARVIPRINAWGITGTPVKDDVKDLLGLLLFLRYEPYCSNTPVWEALIRKHKKNFEQLFRSISIRHTKALVRDELLLPPQKRYVISMPFTAVEEQHYRSLYREMAEACALDVEGSPTVDNWRSEEHEEDMRIWLNRLRQAVLHPEVGIHNRRALGQNRRPMRTIDEVLDAMLEQSETSIRTDERAYLTGRLLRGQLYENSPRIKEGLELWEEVKIAAEKLVSDARTGLRGAVREQKELRAARKSSDDEDDEDGTGSDSDGELGDGESRGKVGEYRRRLRYALEMLHKAVFFCANGHFQIRDNSEMTEPDSEEFKRLKKLEDDGYEEAKVIRREILRESHSKATRLMEKLARKGSDQTFTDVPELVISPDKGIESSRVVEDLEELYGRLNDQANIIDEWREHVIQLLLKPLLDEEDDVETTGEELADSAKFQDQLMVYVQALRAAIADRQDAISGQENELIKHETLTSIKLAKEDGGPDPAKLLELLEIRSKMNPRSSYISMRGAVSDFRGLVSRHSRDAAEGSRAMLEHEISLKQLQATQKAITQQNKAALALESEIEEFRTAMNARLEYYRQLQAVSDSVLTYEGARTDEAIANMIRTEENLRQKLSTTEAKHRYLLNLKEAGSKSNEPRMCVICQTPFVTGVLTVCGHQFCKECMTLWFKSHHNCPVCKKGLTTSMLHDITIKPQELKVHSDTPQNGSSEQSPESAQKRGTAPKKTMIYSEFNADKLAEIKNVELDGPSFMTKVDTLVQHLLWLRESDPGAKSIVFSQYVPRRRQPLARPT